MWPGRKQGGLGLVAELGLVESEDVARLLGNVLGSDILNVVTLSDETITWMHQQDLPATYCKAIALSNKRWEDRHFRGEFETGPQQLLKPTAAPPPFETTGCLGYLVNLCSTHLQPAPISTRLHCCRISFQVCVPIDRIYIEPVGDRQQLQPRELRAKLWWPLLGDALVFTTKVHMSAWKNEVYFSPYSMRMILMCAPSYYREWACF